MLSWLRSKMVFRYRTSVCFYCVLASTSNGVTFVVELPYCLSALDRCDCEPVETWFRIRRSFVLGRIVFN